MASASRALLLARLWPPHAYGIVRPLVAAGSLLPARPWLSPAAVAPAGEMSTAAAVRCFASTRRATSSSSSPQENARLPSSQPPPKETVVPGITDSDSEDKMISDDVSEETAAADDDSGVEKSSGGSASEKRNYGRGPSKETPILLDDGCDFKHWLVVMEPPPGDDPSNPDVPRDEIIDGYIATLAQVVGSVEKARKKIYSVSTRHYFAFGACISEQLSYKVKEWPKVRWVLPDSYLDIKNKNYGGEPFINGKAVPYDHKYHEEWVNATRAHQSICRCHVRRDNMQNLQNRDVPTGRQRLNSPPSVQQTVEPHDVPPVVHQHHAKGNMPPPPDPPPNNGDPPTSQHHVQAPQAWAAAPGSGQKFQQCGALVHQVDDSQDRQDNPWW